MIKEWDKRKMRNLFRVALQSPVRIGPILLRCGLVVGCQRVILANPLLFRDLLVGVKTVVSNGQLRGGSDVLHPNRNRSVGDEDIPFREAYRRVGRRYRAPKD